MNDQFRVNVVVVAWLIVLSCFACGYTVVPTSFVEKAVLSSSDCVFQCKCELSWLPDPADTNPPQGIQCLPPPPIFLLYNAFRH